MQREQNAIEPTVLAASLDVRAVVSRLRRRILQVTDAEDLTPSQASVLMRIRRGDAITASALAAAEQVRQQSMAVTLSSLQQLGLITRSPDPSDGRRQIIELTEAGRERAEGNRHAGVEWLARALQEQYDDAERETIAEAMRLLGRLTS
ncbi:MarR family winged helix-turn-helix transcriptional regulator [Streptomyces tubercidicus]|uniref:MarR family winged helix-turn-helix transcriptional regulator n=1 Tax=Streptomyces tubercidicus TaxID=47759 RepID=UPI002E165232|nr:MarR family transcriptional regulator [Streptomyces tubercidicus]WSX24475.1 MarR family transcriptional regulator [Streptomyces tubercidicus]